MIKLKFTCEGSKESPPFVGKIRFCDQESFTPLSLEEKEIRAWYDASKGGYKCRSTEGEIFIGSEMPCDLDGDIFLFIPHENQAHRLIRRNSQHNTLTFTEQCDQLCIMCSQPPRFVNDRWLIPFYEQAIILSDENTNIGISGGEPTLFKNELLALLENVSQKRPDITFHILTNAQHFNSQDRSRLKDIHQALKVLWGVPMYASTEKEHDDIVKKEGAFNTLMKNLFILASAGGDIELRTVLLKRNMLEFPSLASFISTNLDFICFWAIMNIEPIGYAKLNKEEIFYDFSEFFAPLRKALEIAKLRNLIVSLYNFPLCTVPKEYRLLCADSISDWKKKFLKICEGCSQKEFCGGFFEWYNPEWELKGIHPLK